MAINGSISQIASITATEGRSHLPLPDKPVAVLRKRRNESAFYFLVLALMAGYVGKVHFVDGYPVPHLPYLTAAAVLALYTMAALVRTYHRELKRRKS